MFLCKSDARALTRESALLWSSCLYHQCNKVQAWYRGAQSINIIYLGKPPFATKCAFLNGFIASLSSIYSPICLTAQGKGNLSCCIAHQYFAQNPAPIHSSCFASSGNPESSAPFRPSINSAIMFLHSKIFFSNSAYK